VASRGGSAGPAASNPFMNATALTLLVSLCLAGIFIVSFAFESKRRRKRSLERESLLPLDDSDES